VQDLACTDILGNVMTRTLAELILNTGRTDRSIGGELDVSAQTVNGWKRGVVPRQPYWDRLKTLLNLDDVELQEALGASIMRRPSEPAPADLPATVRRLTEAVELLTREVERLRSEQNPSDGQ
jgi:hypothetical protein